MAEKKVNKRVETLESVTPVSETPVSVTPAIITTPEIDRVRKDDKRMVQGIFRFNSVPGGTLCFMFKEHKDDPIMKYTLKDNTLVTIPLGVAKHLNKRGRFKVHKYSTTENGVPLKTIGQMQNRFEFHSTEFVDVGEYDKSVSCAEFVTK